MIVLDDLEQLCPGTKATRLASFVEPLNAAMAEFEINNVARETAFLAQLAHESGAFRYVREIASGQDYDEGRKAERLGNTPEDDDDGVRYKGRGLIQITGENNYRACSTALFGDPDRLLFEPALLERPDVAARSAAWFWKTHGLNELADAGDFRRITKRINGGLTGWQDRLAYFERAQGILA